ncbi:MAG: hypothetical protein KDA64_17130 [Rhodospirillaceae bacterium]|nr:hypothetical protein [Rhodospirillaceae bacterium]
MTGIPTWLTIAGLVAALVIVMRGSRWRMGAARGRWPLFIAGWLAIIVVLVLIYQYVWHPAHM